MTPNKDIYWVLIPFDKKPGCLNEALFRMISYLDRQECHVAKKKNDAPNDRCHDSSIYRYFFPFFFEN